MKKHSFISICIFVFISFIQADINQWPSTENDHTKLQFILPEILKKENGYQHKDALFGFPGYSKGSLQTQVVYIRSNVCDRINNDNDQNNELERPFALLIDRGGCHFVEKVRNAQHFGASAVIIADDKCLCTDSECLRQTGDTICEKTIPYMADDTSGGDISIPSMLIRKSDAEEIKKQMTSENKLKNTNVMVRFEWGIPSPDGRVEWDLWHSSWDQTSNEILLKSFDIVQQLGKRAYFTPHFVSYNGSKVGCRTDNKDKTFPCGNMCVNGGRYCLLDPSTNHNQEFGASGADVVIENLRRKCIWNIVTKKDKGKDGKTSSKNLDFADGVGLKWWKYVIDFINECNVKNNEMNEERFKNDNKCYLKILKKHDIDINEVNSCMQPYASDSYNNNNNYNNNENKVLENELKEQTNLQLLRLPALYVDGVHARGSINEIGLLNMLCAGYGDHDPPVICACTNESPINVINCVQTGSLSIKSKESGVSWGTVFVLLIIIISGVFSIGLVYYKKTQKQMKEQVRSILAEYMPLEDQANDIDHFIDYDKKKHPAVRASEISPRGFLPTTNNSIGYDGLDEGM